MSNKLIEIPRSEWIKLRDLYKSKEVFSSSYNLLNVFVNWPPEVNVKIFALNGEWMQDGTYIAKVEICKEKVMSHVYCNTLSENCERLLLALKCMGSSEPYLLLGFQEAVLPTVERYVTDLGLDMQTIHMDKTFWYHLPKEQALQFDIQVPADLKLKPLEEIHAEQVNSVWPHRAPGTIEFVKFLIKYNDNIGIFDNSNHLIGWCFIAPLGNLSLLQVVEEHKCKGLGSLLVRYMSKLIASKNIEVTSPVIHTNTISNKLFTKLKFKVVDNVYWCHMPAK